MDAQIKRAIIRIGNNRTKEANLTCVEESSQGDGHAEIVLSVDDLELSARSDVGFFDALRQIRLRLEERDMQLVCNGAGKNVYPSPMIQSMGAGDQAYRLTMGKPATLEDLVDIFDFDDGVEPVSVAVQESYYDEWLNSL